MYFFQTKVSIHFFFIKDSNFKKHPEAPMAAYNKNCLFWLCFFHNDLRWFNQPFWLWGSKKVGGTIHFEKLCVKKKRLFNQFLGSVCCKLGKPVLIGKYSLNFENFTPFISRWEKISLGWDGINVVQLPLYWLYTFCVQISQTKFIPFPQ